MSIAETKQMVLDLSSGIDARFVRGFLDRMDEDYFEAFSAAEIANHIASSSRPGKDKRNKLINTQIVSADNGEFIITVVGFDYPSQLAVLCGLLSAFGLDIRSGDIYSFSKDGLTAARIVDVFRVSPASGESFDTPRQEEFQRELETFTQLLAARSITDARQRLNRFLTERIERMAAPPESPLATFEINFRDDRSTNWTVMEVRSDDAFGILHAVANALAMRGVYVHKARIRSEEGRTLDEFFIADSFGRRIDKAKDRQQLQWAVALIARFTRFLKDAPDPATAMRHFDQLLDKLAAETEFPEQAMTLLAGAAGLNVLAHLLGSSDYLWDAFLGSHFRDLLPMLGSVTKAPEGALPQFPTRAALQQALRATMSSASSTSLEAAEKKTALNAFKDRQVFLIETLHVVHPDASLTEFSSALTDLAEVVVSEAAAICLTHLVQQRGDAVPRLSGNDPPFALFALGKFGGREMGHASDLELLFVHDAPDTELFEALARQTVDLIEAHDKSVFHIDLRLRPYGDAGPRSTHFNQFVKYYSAAGAAVPFERQALIKLRWFTGNADLGRRVEAHRDAYTYSSAAWDWQDAMTLRGRQMVELVKPGQVNVKYSAGGLIDIEYAVQYLQLLNGAEHPGVRNPTTLYALDVLRELQIVREDDYWLLRASYLFLRRVIDALRIVRGNASDLVLPDANAEEFKALARRMGYHGRERSRDAAALAADIQQTMRQVHAYFVNRFDAG